MLYLVDLFSFVIPVVSGPCRRKLGQYRTTVINADSNYCLHGQIFNTISIISIWDIFCVGKF